VGQRDERAAIVSNGKSGKIPTRRRQGGFTQVAVNNAQLRAPVEEDALTLGRSLEHRRGAFRKVWLDHEGRQMPGRRLGPQTAALNCLLQRPINR
jgi:hypothetical protein